MRTLNDFLKDLEVSIKALKSIDFNKLVSSYEHSYNMTKEQSHIVIDVLQFIYESLCKVSTDRLQKFLLNQVIPETIDESNISQINIHIFSLNFLDQIDKIYNLVKGKYTTIHKTQLVKAILDNTKNIIEKFLTTKYLPAYECNQLISIVGDANNYNIVSLNDRQQKDQYYQVSSVLLNNPNLNRIEVENEAFFMPIMLISLVCHNKIYAFTHPNYDNKYYYVNLVKMTH